MDVPAEFAKLHRPRSGPRRLDDNPESAAQTSMMNFYDREFKEVLDIVIVQGRYKCKFGEGESTFDHPPTTTEFPT